MPKNKQIFSGLIKKYQKFKIWIATFQNYKEREKIVKYIYFATKLSKYGSICIENVLPQIIRIGDL